VRECTALVNNVILQDNIQEHCRWLFDPIHDYSVRETYCFLTSVDEPMADGADNNVWHKLVPSKVSLFAWCLLKD
jgi:hypothetical protein